MRIEMPSGATLRARAEKEAKDFAIIAGYLFIVFCALAFLKSAVLESQGVNWTPWGFAAVKALLSAKFIMLGRALHLARGQGKKPLVWQTLYQSLVFLIFVSALNVIEEAIIGRLHGEAFRDTFASIGEGRSEQLIASAFVMFLVFVPFFAFAALNEVMRDKGLVRTFFVKRLEFAAIGEQPVLEEKPLPVGARDRPGVTA